MGSSRDKEYRLKIGKRFMEVRNDLGFSRGRMCREFGVSQSGYLKYENGICLPGLPVLEQFKDKFDISIDWLLFGHGPKSYKEKITGDAEEKRANAILEKGLADFSRLAELAKVMPELGEFLSVLSTDSLFRSEILVNFQKNRQEVSG